MKRYLDHIIESTEKRVDYFRKIQVWEPGSKKHGGMEGYVTDVKPTVFAMRAAASVYYHPESKYYKNRELKEAMERAIQFIAQNQHEDGSFDFLICNFKSAPDTAFCFHALYKTWELFQAFADKKEDAALISMYEKVLKKSAEAIRDGGFHTPNHRWAICAALMQAAKAFPEDTIFVDRCKKRTEQYLAEGIDGNEDGEYAERSTGGYNGVVNEAMINLFESTGDASYLEYAKRNLLMMFQYYEPDDSIFTQGSTRQDRGKKVYADMYFHQYLFLITSGILTKEEETLFSEAAHKMIRDNLTRGDMAPDCLFYLMLNPAMNQYTFNKSGFLGEYRKFFKESGVLRVRKGSFSYTVLNGKSDFLYVNVNGMNVCFKIGESFCEVRSFIPQKIEPTKDGCVISSVKNVWYYLPWEEPVGTTDWWQMDNTKRSLHISDTIFTEVTVTELEDGIAVKLHTEGLEHLPLRLQLCVPTGTILRNDALWMKAPAGESMILRSGKLELVGGEQILEFGEGFGEHEFQGHYSGEEANGGFTIYCNASTPVDKTVYLKVKRA